MTTRSLANLRAFRLPSVFHPGTLELLWLQSRGRRRRMIQRFRQPRRFLLSGMAIGLAAAWLGNAALTVWLRETASPVTLSALLSLGLTAYAAWHFAKAAFFRPETPFEWTDAERDQLSAMPLLPRELVAYQVASVTVTTVLKAGLFTVLLLPDLRSPLLGFVGLFLALIALELLRLGIDVVTWGMGRVAYLCYRVLVVGSLLVTGFAVGAFVWRQRPFLRIDLGDGLLDRFLALLVQLEETVFGYVALPFRPLLDLIVVEKAGIAEWQLAAVSAATVVGLAAAVIGLYAVTARRVAQLEREKYVPTARLQSEVRSHRLDGRFQLRLARVPRWGGAGPLAWRQFVGAGRHWGSLLTAMIAPAILTCGPLLMISDPFDAFLCTMATLQFYTFLLLPTALRFDFHRDFERLTILKGLPAAAAAAVIGQTLAPVVIATVFQAVMLAAAIAVRSQPMYLLPVAMLVMLPLNVIVFALENLIFLLYPHRLKQEGLEVFFRTMLSFTAKGILFAFGLAAVAGWGLTAAALTTAVHKSTGIQVNAHALFAAGMVVSPTIIALLTVYTLCRTYEHLDAAEDVPR